MGTELADVYILPNHDAVKWEAIVSTCSRSGPLTSWAGLKDLIKQLCASTGEQVSVNTSEQEFAGLDRMVFSLSTADSDRFCTRALPAVVDAALSLQDVFPERALHRLRYDSPDGAQIACSEHQIRAVLAHMLLCTTKRQGCVPFWSHFGVWLHDGRSPPVAVYLRCLFEYFCADPGCRVVVFKRRSVARSSTFPDVGLVSTALGGFLVRDQGAIGDTPNEIEVDFANCAISFGRGGTQEEILIGMSPELCVIPLIVDTLLDCDTLLVQGARRYGVHSGYGLDLSFVGAVGNERLCPRAPTGGWSQRYIVAMDATNFAYDDLEHVRLLRAAKGDETEVQRKQLAEQLEEAALRRELLKAFSAFRPLEDDKHIAFNALPVATGLWGCGAFAGDPELKAMLQWISASLAGRDVVFYTFGDKHLASSLQRCVNKLHSRQATVRDLLQWIDNFASDVKSNSPSAGLSLASFLLENTSC